jgi:hypothetical protein
MNPTRDSDSLVAAIAPLAKQIAAIQRQMHALDMFASDREWLECQRCGLKEDAAHDGRLITCREPDLGQDTSLRSPIERSGALSRDAATGRAWSDGRRAEPSAGGCPPPAPRS